VHVAERDDDIGRARRTEVRRLTVELDDFRFAILRGVVGELLRKTRLIARGFTFGILRLPTAAT